MLRVSDYEAFIEVKQCQCDLYLDLRKKEEEEEAIFYDENSSSQLTFPRSV
jgi:hypothetical protein